MTDNATDDALLCRAIHVLAYFEIDLVITNTAGQPYHFEIEGELVQESDLILRAAMLDTTFFMRGRTVASTSADRRFWSRLWVG